MLVDSYGFDPDDEIGKNKWIKNKIPWLKHRFGGMTLREYTALLYFQNGHCGICGGPPNGHGGFHLDHDHNTKELRGMLCYKCNQRLGLSGDDIGPKSQAYLKNPPAQLLGLKIRCTFKYSNRDSRRSASCCL